MNCSGFSHCLVLKQSGDSTSCMRSLPGRKNTRGCLMAGVSVVFINQENQCDHLSPTPSVVPWQAPPYYSTLHEEAPWHHQLMFRLASDLIGDFICESRRAATFSLAINVPFIFSINSVDTILVNTMHNSLKLLHSMFFSSCVHSRSFLINPKISYLPRTRQLFLFENLVISYFLKT